MIKKTICIYTILLLATTITTSTIFATDTKEYDQISVESTFTEPKIKQITIGSNIYDKVILNDAPCTGETGEPSLPSKGINILLPQQTDVEKITITTNEKICLGEGYNVLPVGETYILSDTYSDYLPVPDQDIYDSEVCYPNELFDKIGVYSYRGYDILVLSLHPVQYNPSTGKLFYYKEMTINIELAKTKDTNMLFRANEKDKQEVMRKVDNPNVAETYTKTKINPKKDEYDLLIITTDTLKPGFEPLKDAHNADGCKTIIKTTTDIGGNTPEDIRQYIRDAYINLSIDYVLIGGDDDVIHAKDLYVEAGPYIEHNMPADIYYACLDGTYNNDGDNRWGEPNDGEGGGDVDLIAEVYAGRACVGNNDEVNHFVNKTISYINKDPDDEYLKDVLMAGEYTGFGGVANWGGNSLDELIDGSSNHGYTTAGIPSDEYNISRLYDRDWSGNYWPKSAIINYINNGVHFINHIGHGQSTSAMKMYTTDVYDLTNDKHCFIYSQTCLAGHFDGGDCFAEYMNIKTNNGAFSIIMNARYGFGASYSTDGPSHRYNREFWDAVFGENILTVGRANHDSKEDNLWRINSECMRWCYYEINLFGDPTLDIISYSEPPEPEPIVEIGNITGGLLGITVEIKNKGECNVTDIVWDISVRGGIFEMIDMYYLGSIPLLEIGDVSLIETGLNIVGLGNIVIHVSAEISDTEIISKRAKGFVLFLYITNIVEIDQQQFSIFNYQTFI